MITNIAPVLSFIGLIYLFYTIIRSFLSPEESAIIRGMSYDLFCLVLIAVVVTFVTKSFYHIIGI